MVAPDPRTGSSNPSNVGVAFADVWQCPKSVDRTFDGVKIHRRRRSRLGRPRRAI